MGPQERWPGQGMRMHEKRGGSCELKKGENKKQTVVSLRMFSAKV